MNVYQGHVEHMDWWVSCNGIRFSPDKSLTVRNHSPDGFAWGYSGSGPAQLALALLLNETSQQTAIRLYQQFKDAFVARWNKDKGWKLTSNEIADWLRGQ